MLTRVTLGANIDLITQLYSPKTRLEPAETTASKTGSVLKHTTIAINQIDAHYLSTRSRKAESILARWDVYYSRFTKVIPKEYEAMEEAIRTGMAEGLTREEAIRKAYDKKFGK